MGGGISTKIHKSNIIDFIKYVKNKGIICDATRISAYHKIQERIILKNMFLPVKFDTNKINIQSRIIDAKELRNKLLAQLTHGINNIISKEFKDGRLIRTHKDIADIIHNNILENIFSSIIIEQYKIYEYKNENISKFTESEIFKTFIAQINLLAASFKREMHSKYIDTKIDNNIFINDDRNKMIYINKIFIDIITFVLGKFIKDESNIYQALIYKNSLLKLTLI